MIIKFSDKEKKYEQSDFLKEASEIINNTIENEQAKENIIHQVAEQIAKTANRAGISASFDITEEFMQRIFDETAIGLVRGGFCAFESDDGVYRVHIIPAARPGDPEDPSPYVLEVAISRNVNGNIQIFDESSGWLDIEKAEKIMFEKKAETAEDTLQIPKETVLALGDEDQIEFYIGIDYFQENPGRTIEDWNLFKTENEKLITLIKKKEDILDFRILDGRLYAIPADNAHFGIMLGYAGGKYEIFQTFSIEEIIGYYGDNGLVDYVMAEAASASNRESFIWKVGEMKSLYEAMQFSEAHIDRNTTFAAAVTIPLSKNLVLHLNDEVLDRPEIIWNRLGKSNKNRYSRRNIKNLVGFLKETRELIMSVTYEILKA